LIEMLYQPIDSSRFEIRLLSIAPGGHDEPLVFHVITTSLAQSPQYIALSYVWGSASDTREITIKGHQVKVTKNLHSLMLQCRRWAASQDEADVKKVLPVFWTDAICINQQDNDEKSKQVQMMGSIYSQAARVVSWLGPDEDGQLAAGMKAITAIGGDGTTEDFLQVAEMTPWLVEEDDKDEILPNKAWLGVKALFEEPYWQRIWILQEIVLAREDSLSLWAGESAIPFAQLLRFVQLVSACFQQGASKPGYFPFSIWEWLTRNVATMDGIAWGIDYMQKSKQALHRTGLAVSPPDRSQKPDNGVLITIRFMATNPKDKIFALYNICNTYIAPDYNKSIREVYSDFAREYFMRAPNLKVLKLAGLECLGSNEYNLPSWVPDWQSLSKHHTTASFVVFGEMGGSASSGVFPTDKDQSYITIENDYTFKTLGCILDTAMTKENQMSPASPELQKFTQEYAWSSNTSQYPTGIPRILALLRTLTLNGQPTLMTDNGMPDIELSSVEGQCLLLLALFISSGPGENTTLATFRSLFESLGIPPKGQFKSFLQRILPEEEIGEVWNEDDAAIDLLLSSSFTAAAFMEQVLTSCVIFQTLSGYLGIAPKVVEAGDCICVLPRCNFPVLLRRHGLQFQFVGACFVLGFMRGEAAELLENGLGSLLEIEIV
jgi:hypothetical protein